MVQRVQRHSLNANHAACLLLVLHPAQAPCSCIITRAIPNRPDLALPCYCYRCCLLIAVWGCQYNSNTDYCTNHDCSRINSCIDFTSHVHSFLLFLPPSASLTPSISPLHPSHHPAFQLQRTMILRSLRILDCRLCLHIACLNPLAGTALPL